jgi:hypothetical protein
VSTFARGRSIARTVASCSAVLVSIIGFGVIVLAVIGVAWSDGMSTAAAQQADFLLVLAFLSLVGFDVVMFAGVHSRRGYVAAAACLGMTIVFIVGAGITH